MPGFYKTREKLKKKGHQQQPDMHPIDIRIGGYNNIIITEIIQAVLNIQRMLEQVEFLIFINHFFCKTVAVQWLSFQTENGLGHDIPGFGDGPAGRISLGYEQGRFLLALMSIFKMDLAVSKL